MTLDDVITLLVHQAGLVLFTVLGVALMVYLAYSMTQAEHE
jgi:hypothetical protein